MPETMTREFGPGLAALIALLRVIEDPASYKAKLAGWLEAAETAEMATANLGFARDIPKLHEAAAKAVQDAQAKFAEAQVQAANLSAQAAGELADAQERAGQLMEQAQTRIREAKEFWDSKETGMIGREREVNRREEAVLAKERELAKRETAVVDRERAVRGAENDLAQRLAGLEAARRALG